MTRPALHRRSLLALLPVLLAACSDASGPPRLAAETCGDATRLHAGSKRTEQWRASDNPHAVVDTLHITGTLTIEAGVEVCIEPDVPILIADGGALRVAGTAADSVVFTTPDPARPWGGILAAANCSNPQFDDPPCGAGSSVMEYARIEHAHAGVWAGEAVRIEHTHLRQIRCTAAITSYLAHSRVDSAGLDGCSAVIMGHAASEGGTDHFEDNRIVGSGGAGLSLSAYRLHGSTPISGGVALLGGRIEGSQGVGLRFIQNYVQSPIIDARPIRITGGASVVAHLPMGAFLDIWPTLADQDSLLGNAGDTIQVWGGSQGRPLGIAAGVVLATAYHTTAAPVGAVIDSEHGIFIEPGGELFLGNMLRLYGPLIAEGTPDAPVRIGGGVLEIACDPVTHERCDVGSRIVHAEIDGFLHAPMQALFLEHVVADAPYEISVGDGSRLFSVHVMNAETDALLVGSNVHIEDCVVVDGGGNGIVVPPASTNVRIRNCVFESNRFAAVLSESSDTVDARFNWWGDPAGPLGPNGDGVEGNVDYSQHLTNLP